jgi:mono/diheme cytochrome c family protein
MVKKYVVASILALSLLALPTALACSKPSTTTMPPTSSTTTSVTSTPPTSSTHTTPTTSLTTTTTTPTGATFQSLSTDGGSIFSSTCAVCHGPNGQGTNVCPVIMWGTGSTLGSYNGQTLFSDGATMLSWMSSSMPLTAPGSLTSQQYTDLLAYILLQDGKVSGSTVYNQSQLGSIKIP